MKKIALILLVLLPAFVKADFKTLSTEQVQGPIGDFLNLVLAEAKAGFKKSPSE
jgi:hypothetical protein